MMGAETEAEGGASMRVSGARMYERHERLTASSLAQPGTPDTIVVE